MKASTDSRPDSTGARIRARREAQGLTLQQIAQKIGVDKSTVQRYENDAIAAVKQPVIAAIASALSTTADYLLCKTDDPAPTEIGMDDFTYALYNESRPLTQANKEKLLEMARFFRAQQEKEQERER